MDGRMVARALPRFRRARRELDSLAARELWPRERIEQFQIDRINKMWAHATAHVPYYRELAAASQLPPRFDDLDHFSAAVPQLEKTTVRDHPDRLKSERATTGHWHRTSGSSGVPTSVFRSDDAHRAALQAQYRFQRSWGVDFLDRWVFLWGNGGALAPGLAGWKDRIRVPVEDTLRGRLRLSPYDLSAPVMRDHLERITRFRPAAIYAHSMAAHMLALEAERVQATLPSLRLVVLTAEPVRQHTRTTVERALGAPAVVEYGCNESGVIAGEAPDGTLRVRDDHVVVETLPRVDGRFDIVITVLDNPSFPLFRYALGDVTDRPLERFDHGFGVLGEIVGRDFDLLMAADGRTLHGQSVEDLVDKYPGVRQWRVRQDTTGGVQLVIEGDLLGSHEELRTRVEAMLGGFPVELQHVDTLDPIRAGKHRTVSSQMVTLVDGVRTEPHRPDPRQQHAVGSPDDPRVPGPR